MIPRFGRLWFAAGLAAAATGLTVQVSAAGTPAGAAVAPAPIPVKGGDEMIDSFKLSEGDLDSVLSALETFTGKTIVRPGQLPMAPYSLRITRPIPKSELITALETLLALNQIAVEPMGDRFLKVTATSQARSEAPEMIDGSTLDLPPSNRIATKVFELSFMRVSEFTSQIQSMLTPYIGGGVVPMEKANVVMITDSLVNLQRIERLLAIIDQPRQRDLNPKFYQLVNGAKASDLVAKIHTMLSGPAQSQLRASTTYSADDRTNQIVLIADPREYPLFDALIHKLDIRSDPNTNNEVIYLKHADAKDVSTLLTALITGQNAAAQKSGTQSVTHAGGPPQPATPPAAAPAGGTASDALLNGATEFSSFVTIQPDERTNSVVVSGTVDDLRMVRSIIDKIDILLAQVRIEVVIAEVTFSDTSNSGVNTSASSGPTVAVGTAPNGGTSITGASGSVAGLTIGPSASGTAAAASLGGINPINIIASLSSLGAVSKTKILQESTIVTTHAKEASLTVTDQLPVLTGATSTPVAAGVAAPSFAQSSSITYKDIGIILKVTPLIGDDGSIQLKVDQTVDDQGPPVTIDGNSQPQINHREATSFINVMNDQLVVLGGFQSSTKSISRQRFGVLYEIPILSNLLGYRTNDTERTELLLFLRPHVIQAEEGTADTRKAVNGMENKDQVNHYLADPSRIPDAQMSVKDRWK